MDMQIYFPNLGIFLEHVGKNFSVFGFEVAFYGCVIAIGIMAGYMIAAKEAKRTGQNPEDYLDLIMYGVFFALIGARLYYVAFSWEYYKDNLLSILNLRQGGLAIYGGIIGAFATVYVFSKKRKLSVATMLDTVSMGLVTGQIIGRWGNFFNREAFGDYTDGLLAMQLPVSAVRSGEITEKMWENLETIHGVDFIQVHPTFLYEGLWNLGVLLFLLWYRDRKKFQGELVLWYLALYGAGRFWIEALRTDQLLIPGIGFPISQLLGFVLAVGGMVTIFIGHQKVKKSSVK